MGQAIGKGISYTSGFRYYFAVLAGICRGPVDEIFLIKSADHLLFDSASQGKEGDMTLYDPNPVGLFSEDGAPGDGTYPGGPIRGNTTLPIFKPDLYGGDQSEGGVKGFLWTYFGAKDQLIPAGDWMRTCMAGLLLPSMRGVLTTFFDGEVTANNPYPKAWKYRVRRALKGWDGDVWYPEKALMILTDSSIPVYVRGVGDTTLVVTTIINSPGAIDTAGASTGSATQTQIQSNYEGATVNTYSSATGLSTEYLVPREYNVINAMNPAHILYECLTNRDWGRGLDRALIDHVSFAAAADTLFAEQFGLCMKWSRTEDIDRFCQTVIDHCGGVVYTDRISGLLCLRLIRSDYDVASLSVFDFEHGLLEVTSITTAANDTNPNEVVVKYHSPVIDADKEARQQNTAAINKLGCVFSVSRDYSGLPTADLAIRVAARDLRIASHAWKNVSFKVDRRGYLITPGDCLILNVPERGLNNIVIRVGTVEDSVITDGSITIVGSQDAYGLPTSGVSQQQMSEWLPIDASPKGVYDQLVFEASYWDVYRSFTSPNDPQFIDAQSDPYIGFQAILASKPSGSSLSYRVFERKFIHFSTNYTEWAYSVTGSFATYSKLMAPMTTTTTTVAITNDLDPRAVDLPQLMFICGGNGLGVTDSGELVYVTAITRDRTTGQRYAVMKRGCIDTCAVPHPINARLYNYQQSATIDPAEYTFNDLAQSVLLTRTTQGELALPADPATLHYSLCGFGARFGKPYCGSNFRINGYPRDQMPTIDFDLGAPLTCTWHHRNKVTQADKIMTEEDGDVVPNINTQYQVFFSSGDIYFSVGTTDNHVVVPASEFVSRGVRSGPMKAFLWTYQSDLPNWAAQAAVNPTAYFNVHATPPTPPSSGFDVQFDQNFGS